MKSSLERVRRRTRLLLAGLAALLVLALLLVLWWLRREVVDTDIGTVERTNATTEGTLDVGDAELLAVEPSAPATQSSTDAAETEPAAPETIDLSRPVDELLQLLGPRARAGDAHAACDLMQAMRRCGFLRSFAGEPLPPEPGHDADARTLDRYVSALALHEESAAAFEQSCAELTERDYREAPRFLLIAARGGYLPAVYDFAALPMRDQAALLRDPMLATAYRAELWPMYRRALATGDRSIVELFAVSVMRENAPLTAVVPERYQNPAVARAFLARFANPDARTRLYQGIAPPSQDDEASADRWLDALVGRQPEPGPVSGNGLALDYGPSFLLDRTEGCRDSLWLHQ